MSSSDTFNVTFLNSEGQLETLKFCGSAEELGRRSLLIQTINENRLDLTEFKTNESAIIAAMLILQGETNIIPYDRYDALRLLDYLMFEGHVVVEGMDNVPDCNF